MLFKQAMAAVLVAGFLFWAAGCNRGSSEGGGPAGNLNIQKISSSERQRAGKAWQELIADVKRRIPETEKQVPKEAGTLKLTLESEELGGRAFAQAGLYPALNIQPKKLYEAGTLKLTAVEASPRASVKAECELTFLWIESQWKFLEGLVQESGRSRQLESLDEPWYLAPLLSPGRQAAEGSP